MNYIDVAVIVLAIALVGVMVHRFIKKGGACDCDSSCTGCRHGACGSEDKKNTV